MVTKKQEYLLSFFGLAAVVLAFLALLWNNSTIALAAAAIAILVMVMSIMFIYREEEKLESEVQKLKSRRER